MVIHGLPAEFQQFSDCAVSAIRRVYDTNAARHDVDVGDDAVTFGFNVYRNSWYEIEQEVSRLDGWSASRPAGSLVIVGAGLRVHVYRCGQDGEVDLGSFRLDGPQSSGTQRDIATANSAQLQLDFDGIGFRVGQPAERSPVLRELAIVHAGNPDDGCCGVWIGAPVVTEDATASPWAWVEPLWLAAGSKELPEPGLPRVSPATKHSELSEPDLILRPIPGRSQGREESRD